MSCLIVDSASGLLARLLDDRRYAQSAGSVCPSDYYFHIYATHLSVGQQCHPIPCKQQSVQHMTWFLVSPSPLAPFNAQIAPSSELHPRDLPGTRRFAKQVDSAYLLSVRNHAHSQPAFRPHFSYRLQSSFNEKTSVITRRTRSHPQEVIVVFY